MVVFLPGPTYGKIALTRRRLGGGNVTQDRSLGVDRPGAPEIPSKRQSSEGAAFGPRRPHGGRSDASQYVE